MKGARSGRQTPLWRARPSEITALESEGLALKAWAEIYLKAVPEGFGSPIIPIDQADADRLERAMLAGEPAIKVTKLDPDVRQDIIIAIDQIAVVLCGPPETL